MYRAFFNLQSKPFETAPDTSFLWLGEKHKEALAALRYGILENKGFVLLTGGPGSGKTTLVNALISGLEQGVLAAVITDPNRERLDFYNAIAAGFGLAKEFTSKVQFLIQFSHFLHQAEDEGKKVLLVIDDCQRLSQEMLEELRLLSNIEKADAKLINIFFVGLREFNDTLIQPNNRAMRQRLTVKVDLPPLSLRESEEYIRHRLRVAGTVEQLFSAKAMQVIHKYSMGIPKRINIICDHTMAAGAVQGKRLLDHKIVEECLQKLNLPFQPTSEDFEELAEEKSHLEHPRGRYIPAANGGAATAVSGSTRQHTGRAAWLKYAALGLAMVGIALVFWYVGKRISTGPLEPVKVQESVAVKEPPAVRPSPAVAVLEPNESEINGKKAAELKSAILEKAYGNGDGSQVSTPGATGVEKGEGTTVVTSQPSVPIAGEEIATTAPPVIPVATGQNQEADKIPPPSQVKPPKAPALPAKVILPLAANSLKLTASATAELRALLGKLQAAPNSRLLVKGFVSSATASAENTKLSEERALAVHKLLVAGGIEAGRIEVKGMGIEEPIASNDTAEGRSKNRRVEIVVLAGDGQ